MRSTGGCSRQPARCWAALSTCRRSGCTSMTRYNPPNCSKLLRCSPHRPTSTPLMPALNETIAPITELRTESTGPNECRISIRFKDGYEPFPENCAFKMGLHAACRGCSGIRDVEVFDESCQCDGAPYCQARMRWEWPTAMPPGLSRAELAARRPRPASKSSTTRWPSSSPATASRPS